MTVNELIAALVEMRDLGYGERVVTHYTKTQLDPTHTAEVTGLFAGSEADDEDVVLETVTWHDSTAIMPDCLCRTRGCGHLASQHTGPEGACVVAACACGPGGWS